MGACPVLHNSEIVGTWRSRKSGAKLTILVQPWVELSASLQRTVAEQAERLATHRRVRLAGIQFDG